MKKRKVLRIGILSGFLGGMIPAIFHVLIKGSEIDPLLFGIFIGFGIGLAVGFTRYFYFKN